MSELFELVARFAVDDPLASALLAFAVRGSLLVLLAALVARLPRRAATRHLIWAVAVVGLALLPLLGLTLPGIGVPLLPAAAPASAGGERHLQRQPASQPAAAPAVEVGVPLTPVRTASTAPLRAAASSSAAVARPERLSPFALWPVGTALLLLGLGESLVHRQRLLRRARPLTGSAWRETLAAAGAITGRRQPRLMVSDRVRVPITWGVARPVVLLPAGAERWAPSRRLHVLLHELAHARRGDAALAGVARLACALHWPNPLAWWAAHRLVAESELACDDRVVGAGVRPSGYAAELIRFARELGRRLPGPAAAMARRSGLAKRVRAILDERRDRSAPGRAQAALILVAGLGLAVPAIAALALERRAPAPPALPAVAVAAPAAFAAPAPPTPPIPPAIAGPPGVPAPPAVPTPPAAPQAADFLPGCGEAHGTNIHREGDRWDIRVRTAGCSLDVEVEGDVVFTADEREVASLAPGASLDIEERRFGARRRLAAERGPGGASLYTWSIDGDERPFDADARAWLAEMLPRFFRASGWDAEGRVQRILARAGVDGVFAELELIPGDHVGRLYFAALLAHGELDAGELVRWVRTAGRSLASDYELAQTLCGLPPAALDDPALQAAFIEAAGTIASDYELRRTLSTLLARGGLEPAVLDPILAAAATIASDYEAAELLTQVVAGYPPGQPLPDAFFAATDGIASDYDLRRALAAFLARDDAGVEHLDRMLDAARALESDHEAAELLVALAGRYPDGRPLPPSYFATAAGIGSDHDLRRALQAAAARSLDEAGLTALLTAAGGLGSDHELAELLLAVLARHEVGGGARAAFDAALAGLAPGSERDRVAAAAYRSR